MYACRKQTPTQATPCSRNQRATSRAPASSKPVTGGAGMVDALLDLPDQMERDDPLGLDPEVRVAVTVRDALAADLQHGAEALGRDQAEAAEVVLEQRVGGDRRAVGDVRIACAPFSIARMKAAAGSLGEEGTFVLRT